MGGTSLLPSDQQQQQQQQDNDTQMSEKKVELPLQQQKQEQAVQEQMQEQEQEQEKEQMQEKDKNDQPSIDQEMDTTEETTAGGEHTIEETATQNVQSVTSDQSAPTPSSSNDDEVRTDGGGSEHNEDEDETKSGSSSKKGGRSTAAQSKNEVLLTPTQAKELSKNKRWVYVPRGKKGEHPVPTSPPPEKEEVAKPPARTRKSLNSSSSTSSITTTTTTAATKRITRSSSKPNVSHDHEEKTETPEKLGSETNVAKLRETIAGLQSKIKHLESSPPKPGSLMTSPPSSGPSSSLLSPPTRKFSNLYSDDEDEMDVDTTTTTTATTTAMTPLVTPKKTTSDNLSDAEEATSSSATKPVTKTRKRKPTASATPPVQSRAPQIKKSRSSTSLPNTPLSKPVPVTFTGPGGAERAQRSTKGRRSRGGIDIALEGPMKRCLELLDVLMSHQYSPPFLAPVDPIALKILDYFTVVKHPMDFGTIRQTLTAGDYNSSDEFAADCRLVFSNAMLYNPPANQVHVMAKELGDIFEKRFMKAMNDPPSPELKRGEYTAESDKIKQLTMEVKSMSKEMEKMKRESSRGSIRSSRNHIEEPKPMTLEEKTQLGVAINLLPPKKLLKLIQIISHTLNQNSAQEEIEIDLEKLDTETLRKLESFVVSCFPAGQYHILTQHSQPLQSPPLSSSGNYQTQREIESVTREINKLNRGLSNSKKRHNISKPISKSRGRKLVSMKREEDVVVDDMVEINHPPVTIEKDQVEVVDEGTSGSDSSDSESGSSDSDSSSYSSEYSDSETDQSNHRHNNNNNSSGNNSSSLRSQQSSSSSLDKSTSTAGTGISSTVPTPNIIQPAIKKSIGVPNTVAAWSFDSGGSSSSSLSSSSTTTPSPSSASSSSASLSTTTLTAISSSSSSIHTSTSTTTTSTSSTSSSSTSSTKETTALPPVASNASPTHAQPLSPNSPSLPTLPSPSHGSGSPVHQSNNNNNATGADSTWNHFKAKNLTLIQKERERIEQEEQIKREKEEREEEARREEERKKQEVIEAQKRQKQKELDEEEEAKKQIEASRAAAREAREKASQNGKSNMSFQQQMEMMASFENGFSNNESTVEMSLNLQFKQVEDNYDSSAAAAGAIKE
ncbi:hypothetical protein SAMD00019534_106640 [Acytostelium subglobosum LB1]|uniref:hypothetical protein n=1 Tax=Acytostelium subglobosum LB1 TaxID=1410327 RepID=UPI000644AC6A|nr:hypothetical protein SAMD00019534_106640 [Acytostelium subglobosum LB1]GAM27488.1 hypothetical protein SAMD00019534_106640 [Acytostelium subglobosum LB1]|eukprot:XP_012749553.1 hypothetical protein SAMD00019534_106640 [Acytostelium subglobosum LB1]